MKQITHIGISILLLALLYIRPFDAYAQVTIGSTDVPESFSALQIDGTGGLRLPQLTNAQASSLRTKLYDLPVAEREAVAGLIICNIDGNKIEYWDGEQWAIVGSKITIENGITKTATNIELGGTLTAATAINVNDKKLGFEGGKWSVNSTVFEVDGDKVTINPSTLAVHATTLSADASGYVKANGTFTASNAGTTLTIDADKVKITGQLRYNNAKKGDGKVLTAGYTGKAYWEELRPENIKEEGSMKADGTGITTEVSILSNTPLRLTSGKWLVFAKVTAKTTSSSRMHLWLSLRKQGATGFICVSGGDVDANGYTTPQFTYFLTVPEDGNYELVATTSNINTTLIDNALYGKPYFYAILIDKPQSED